MKPLSVEDRFIKEALQLYKQGQITEVRMLEIINHQTKLARINEKNHAYNLVGVLETPQMVRDELKGEIKQLQGEIE